MCGIAGYISNNNVLSPADLQAGADSMFYRGPDADGFYYNRQHQVGLAHRRLSILDLSTGANQPMVSADGRYVIVFNGEIYNFQELKSRLPDKGQSLKTTGDTEVILELFAAQGPSFIADMNGMFAFAIYDRHLEQLTICRDHVGIKPLFVYADDRCLIFASELKVISTMLRHQLTINKNAIPYFLHLGFIPEPATIYNNTFKFKSGHYLQIDIRTHQYLQQLQQPVCFWNPIDQITGETFQDEAAAKKQLDNLLTDAVSKQLVSDVPIGTFLSGGIDSSLVTALAAKSRGAQGINSFSIAIDNGKYNEGKFAKAVSKHLGTAHHEFVVKEKEVLELIDRFLPAYDEPFADSSAFPTMMVSRLARQQVTVALSGDGGDELFHGYGMYQWAKRLAHPLLPIFGKPAYAATRLMNSRFQRLGHLFDIPANQQKLSHIFSQEQYYFKQQELDRLLTHPNYNFSEINRLPKTSRILSPEEQQSLWDFRYYLKDDLLVKVDRASMQYSLESRVPLLDYRVVNFALNLHPSLKIQGGNMKYLLKEILFQYVPKEIFDRPKWGFSIPLDKWLQTDLRYLLEQYTDARIIEKHGLVNNEEVQLIKKLYFKGANYLYNRLWTLVVLHWWLETRPTSIAPRP